MVARTVEIAFLGSTSQLEAALKRAGLVADESGKQIGDSFAKGTAKAGSAIKGLSLEIGKLDVAGAGSLNKFGTALAGIETKSESVAGAIASIGKGAAIGGLAAFTAAAYEGVKGATALQTSMEQIHTQAGKSQTEVDNMTKSILAMASSVGTNPQALSNALLHIESAGFSGQKALNVLSTAAKGAKVSGADLTQTAQTLASALYSGIPGAQNLSQAMGTLNAAVGTGDMTFDQLNQAFGTPLLAVAKGAGVSLRDIGAGMADLGDLGTRGADAATELRQAIQFMLKPAATAAPVLAQLGLNSQSLANALSSGGLNGALTLLHNKLNDAGVSGTHVSSVLLDLFSKKGSAGITALLNSFDRLQGKYKDIDAGAGSFNADWTATTKNLSFQWAQVEAGAAAFADKLGGYLIPKLQQLGQFVARNKGAFEDLAKAIGVTLGLAIGAFVGQKVASFVGGIGKMVTALEAFVLKSAAMRDAETADMVAMTTAADTAATGIDAALIGTGIGAAIVALGIAADEMATHWQSVMTAMNTAANKAGDAIAATFNAIIRAYNDTIGKIAGQTGTHFSGPTNAPQQLYSINTGTTDVQLKAGTNRDQYLKIQQLYKAGQPLAQAEKAAYAGKSGSSNVPLPAGFTPPGDGGGGGNPTTPPSGGGATTATVLTALQTLINGDTTKGQNEVQKLQAAATSGSFNKLRNDLTGMAKEKFEELNKSLLNVHNAGLNSLVAQMKTAWRSAVDAMNAIQATLKTDAQADIAQAAADKATAQTTASSNAGSAAVGVSGLRSQQTVDNLNNATAALNDAAKLDQDAAQAQLQAIQDQITAADDAASAQVAAITDATQTQVDTLGERGLYGLELQTQMAKVAVDQQKATDDAAIAAAQAHLDAVTSQTAQTAAAAQIASDKTQQQADTAEAALQATADSTAISSAISVAAAQATADQDAVQTAINNAAAQAHVDAVQFGSQQQQQQAAANQKLVQSQGDKLTALADQQLQTATNAANTDNSNAQTAYAQSQAYWSQQIAIANQALTTATTDASTQQALAQQSLSTISNTAAIQEAKLSSIYNVDQEIASTQFSGGYEVNIYAQPGDGPQEYASAIGFQLRTLTT